MKTKLKVGVLGATGAVGQRFVSLLKGHPWFQITQLKASSRSIGHSYGDAVTWRLPDQPWDEVKSIQVTPCRPTEELDLVFSGLPASEAETVEPMFRDAGIPVISNTRSHRMNPLVPLLIPEINAAHLELIQIQKKETGKSGYIVTNPNCSTIVLAMALAPLYRAYGIRKVMVTTAQAISGAGYTGLSAMTMLDNAVPYINGEEPKMESEPLKILGELNAGRIEFADMQISASCTRVSVTDGHLMHVSIETAEDISREEIIHCWDDYQGDTLGLNLPTQPDRVLEYIDLPDRPQPALDRDRGNGMTVTMGRLRPCPILGWKFVALGHNTIRGAAGCALLVAELLVAKGYLPGDNL